MLARLQAGLLLIAILATPSDLVTRVSAQAKDECHGICSPARGAHSMAEQRQARASHERPTSCPRGIAGHFAICVGKFNQRVVYEIVTPQRPATLPDHPDYAGPQLSTQALPVRETILPPGFVPTPFEPPRS